MGIQSGLGWHVEICGVATISKVCWVGCYAGDLEVRSDGYDSRVS